MNEPLKILGIPGSLRSSSYNRAALFAAQSLLPEGVSLEIISLEGLPLFNEDREAEPLPAVTAFKNKIRGADAILFSTPEYNYSVPGVLKNAIDCASRPYGDSAWAGKPVAIMGASVSALGTARAQYHLRQMFVYLNMFPVNQPEVMIGHAEDAFDGEGRLIDGTSEKLIRQLLENLAQWTKQLKK